MKRPYAWWAWIAAAMLGLGTIGCGGKGADKTEAKTDAAAADAPADDASADVAAAPETPPPAAPAAKKDATDEMIAASGGDSKAPANAPSANPNPSGGPTPNTVTPPGGRQGRGPSMPPPGQNNGSADFANQQGQGGQPQGGRDDRGGGQPQMPPPGQNNGSAAFAAQNGQGPSGPRMPPPGQQNNGSAAFAAQNGQGPGQTPPGGAAGGSPSPGVMTPPGGGAGNMGARMRPGGGGSPGPGGTMDTGPGAGGGGGPQGQEAVNDFSSPTKGAQSFLSAVKSRDASRIAQAIAKHARYEASESRKEAFGAAIDETMSADQLDKLVEAFADMKFGKVGQAKGTGTWTIVVTKSNKKGGYINRILTMRHEADGWKVQDFSGALEQKVIQPPKNRQNKNQNGRGY